MFDFLLRPSQAFAQRGDPEGETRDGKQSREKSAYQATRYWREAFISITSKFLSV